MAQKEFPRRLGARDAGKWGDSLLTGEDVRVSAARTRAPGVSNVRIAQRWTASCSVGTDRERRRPSDPWRGLLQRETTVINLDRNTLAQVGLADLPPDLGGRVIRRLYEVLEIRVGERLVKGLTKDQLMAFEGLMERGDEAAALAWLESTQPDYMTTVRVELEELLARLEDGADRLLATARAQERPAAPYVSKCATSRP